MYIYYEYQWIKMVASYCSEHLNIIHFGYRINLKNWRNNIIISLNKLTSWGSKDIINLSFTWTIVLIIFPSILKVRNLDKKTPKDIRIILTPKCISTNRTISLHPNEELLLFCCFDFYYFLGNYILSASMTTRLF